MTKQHLAVNGKTITLEDVPCALCGSENRRLVFQAPDERYPTGNYNFSVVECMECGLSYLNPRPTPKDIQHFYPPQFFSEPNWEKQCNKYADELSRIRVRSGRLLDIGCRNGGFVRYAGENGFLASGFENATCASNPWGVEIFNDFSSIPSNTFDVVTSWAVFEHLHDPAKYFREVSRILKPRGEFILLVPSFASYRSRQMQFEDLPRHLYFYTPATIGQFLKLSNLILEFVEQDNRIYYGGHRKLLLYFAAKIVGLRFKRAYFYNLWTGFRQGNISIKELFWLLPFEHVDRLIHRQVTKWLASRGRNGTIIIHAQKP